METDIQDNPVQESAIGARTTNDPSTKVAFEGDYTAVEIVTSESLREMDMIRNNVSRVLRMVEILRLKVQRKVAQEQAERNKEMLFVTIEDKPAAKTKPTLKLFQNNRFTLYFGPDEDIKDEYNLDYWKNRHIFD